MTHLDEDSALTSEIQISIRESFGLLQEEGLTTDLDRKKIENRSFFERK